MNNDLFEILGLSPNEGKIYETLLERGEMTVGDISVSAKIHRRNTYDAIQRLVDKGLCFQIFSNKENIYNAVDPDKLTEILAEKQEKLNSVLPILKKNSAPVLLQKKPIYTKDMKVKKIYFVTC